MNTAIQAILDENAAPTYSTKADALAATRPLLQFAAAFQRQITEYRARIMDAETAEDLPDAFRGNLEFMHQTLAAAERIAADLVRIGREATNIYVQIDRVFAQGRTDLEAADAKIAAAAVATVGPTVP